MARLGDRVGGKLVRDLALWSSLVNIGACVMFFQIPMTDHILARLGDGNSKIVLQVTSCSSPP
jgi:hypothetical protein